MPINHVPMLETERLVLRAHRADDFPAAVALWRDPDVTRFIGGKPFAPAETWSKLLRYAGMWALLGFGYWALEEKASGRFVGELGFADFKREIQPSLDGLPECGWVIAPAVHGRGYATEAVAAATGWADVHFAGRLTTCIIGPENIASLRVAATAGYREFARSTFAGAPVIIFRR